MLLEEINESCGCDESINDSPPILKEGVSRSSIYSDILYHIDSNLPLHEGVYRYGSKRFIELWRSARELYENDTLTLTGFDKKLLTETDIGRYGFYDGVRVPLDVPMSSGEDTLVNDLLEAEYQGREVELNKPKRGGSKKYYVYVRNPDTDNVIKVEFGDKNLSTKINDPDARKSFAARHKCSEKKDKTKPGYWACNIGRYWKSLGGSKNFSGYW